MARKLAFVRKVVTWKKWKWVAKKAAGFLDGFAKQYGVSLSSVLSKNTEVEYPVFIEVSILDEFAGQIRCSRKVGVRVCEMLMESLMAPRKDELVITTERLPSKRPETGLDRRVP